MALRRILVTFRWLGGVGLLAILGSLGSMARAQDVPPPLPADPARNAPADPNGAAAPADPNVEVLTRGPIHEAFAVPLSAGQTMGIIVPKQPAAPVEEVPPDMKPEGANSVWIPGYWSWDDDRKDFIWVSGVWRAPPPGYRWMPGYWQEVPGQGYQWVSGYWMPAHLEEATFLPQPPQSIETGPTSEAPNANYFWIAGHWQWVGTRYVWQPGYWSTCQADWIWVPASYYWCPRGWVYVPGYWDYPLARRGLVFSPVYFAGPVTYYRPAVCLDAGAFSISLFCRPAYCHYYFGDYYDDHYVALGIRPWFYYHSPRYGYDPLFTYYRWYHVDHLGERQWNQHLVGWHDYYRTHPDMRPPHTYAAQRALLAGAGASRPDLQQLRMVHDVHQISGARLQQVSQVERAQIHQVAKETVRFGAERQKLEHGAIAGGPHVAGQAERVNLSSMPSYKSAQLPGATAANAALSRTNTTGSGPIGPVGPGSAAGHTLTNGAKFSTNPGSHATQIGPVGPVGPGSASGRTPVSGAIVPGGSGNGNPAKGGNGGSGNRNVREKEKKPQASLTPAVTPVTTPAAVTHVDHQAVSGAVTSSINVPKPQPQPQSQPRNWTVMRAETGNASAPPSHASTAPVHPQPPVNNNSGGSSGGHNDKHDDNRGRDKDKK